MADQRIAVDDGDRREAERFAAEEDVFRDGHVGREREFLKDRADSERLRIVGSADECRFSIHADVAVIRPIDSGNRLDQGRFSGTVFAEQRVHLARAHLEVDVIQSDNAGEAL